MAPKKKAKKVIGKKDMKKTKGGLLPAVNQTLSYKELNLNTGLNITSPTISSINLK